MCIQHCRPPRWLYGSAASIPMIEPGDLKGTSHLLQDRLISMRPLSSTCQFRTGLALTVAVARSVYSGSWPTLGHVSQQVTGQCHNAVYGRIPVISRRFCEMAECVCSSASHFDCLACFPHACIMPLRRPIYSLPAYMNTPVLPLHHMPSFVTHVDMSIFFFFVPSVCKSHSPTFLFY